MEANARHVHRNDDSSKDQFRIRRGKLVEKFDQLAD